MQRLLAEAEALTGVKYDINNLGDVYEAIHVIQGELGLTGVAAAEASETFSGSFNAMKAAAQNALGSLALGQNIQPALTALASSVSTFFFGNFIPMLGTIIRSLPSAIVAFIQAGIPQILSGLTSILTSLAASIKSTADSISGAKVAEWVTTTLPKLLSAAGTLINKFAAALLQNLPVIVSAIGKIGLAIITGLGSAIWGKVTAAANGIKDRFMEPINAIKGLAAAAAAAIRDKFVSPIESMRDKVKGIIDKIKGFFPISIGNVVGNLKLPHFSISGKFSINPPSVPSFSVSWYKQGGIVNDATVFGGIGMGEAGPEAILPLTPFWKKMDQIAEAVGSGAGSITINVYGSAGMDVNELAAAVEQRLVTLQKQRINAWGY